MDRTTLTAALKVLERRRLVKVAVDKEDRRSRLLTITPAGRALLAKAFPIWQKAHAAVEQRLAGMEPEKLRAALRTI